MPATLIKPGLYHVGDQITRQGLDSNPYLLIDGDEAVLFDPGSPLDFEIVFQNICELVSLDQIKYVIVHHEDPDFCGALPLLESRGLAAEIVTTFRTMSLVQYYDIRSPYYLIEDHGMVLRFGQGRELHFISTPYLHFAGSFTTYDPVECTLFSSDLFGAFSYNHTLYADDQYMGKMLAFHENYMPANSVLRPVMDTLTKYRIEMILPQHGSIITTNIPAYIQALRTLECGILLTPVRRNLLEDGGYRMVFNEVMERLDVLFPAEAVDEFRQTLAEFEFDPEGKVLSYTGSEPAHWNRLFEQIRQFNGVSWLGVLEPFVRNLCAVYDLQVPTVFSAVLNEYYTENKQLLELNQSLDQTIRTVNRRLLRCRITDLYNETFLRSLLFEELEQQDWRDVGTLACISIDNFGEFVSGEAGQNERELLNNMAYLLVQELGENAVFRMDYTEFALYLKGYSQTDAIQRVEALRNLISASDIFLKPVTVTMGLAFASELELDLPTIEVTIDHFLELALSRLAIARRRGRNTIAYTGNRASTDERRATVLLVDDDVANLEILKNFLEEAGVDVLMARDGLAALQLAREHLPKIIISEVMLGKMDGFVLREELLKQVATQGIETILMSYRKDSASVERAINLGIHHFFAKPYLLKEVIGIIIRKLKE